MHQLGTEEKAALLLTADDDDDDHHEMTNSSLKMKHDNFPVVAKRPKTYQRHRSNSPHPALCFVIILGAFILGCTSGVVIMLYRMSQDGEQRPSPTSSPNLSQTTTIVSLTKLFQSISKTNFVNLDRSSESENDAANKLHDQWKSLSSSFTRVNKVSYDISLTKSAPSTQWSGIQLLDGKSEKELLRIDHLATDNFLSLSSLVKSGIINGTSVYYVNYGRQEDFAYLFSNRMNIQDSDKSIVFMRRNQRIISQTEQIHQAIYYRFAALILFDDHQNQQTTTTNNRHSFFREWARYPDIKERENILNGIVNDKDHSISVLTLSYDDVQRIFGSLQPDSNQWLSCPSQWHNQSTPIKIGGTLSSFKLRLVANMQDVNIQLPVVMGYIRGTMDDEHFIMIGFQVGAIQQNKIINEIVQAYANQIKAGWKPKRSILFCAWSGADYDHYTIRRWLSDNTRLVERNLIAYIDLGNGIIANSTPNLHGSPLLHQIAHRAADSIPSPLKHNHTCHHRPTTTTAGVVSHDENHHDHGRKRRDSGHDHPMEAVEQEECESHKLLDEWMRASNNQIGVNKSLSIVQTIDMESSASLLQLHYGIPSILIEMTDEQALTNDTFYVQKLSPVFDPEIQPEVYVAYTQFVCEIIRQLVDEPLIPFNLTNYADQLDKQVIDFLTHYKREYQSVGSHLGDSSEFTKTLNDLTKSIRQKQSQIDQTSKNDYGRLQSLNQQLIEFERLFITDYQSRRLNRVDETDKHILIGPAFGLTNTIVPFPSLSNILFNIPEDPPTELCDGSRIVWLRLKENIQLIIRILNGLDGLLTKDK